MDKEQFLYDMTHWGKS